MAFISNGTTILDNGAFSVSLGGGKILLSTQTASASASISFTTGIDSTYDIYEFEFINIHPSTDNVGFQFNMSTDGGSNYNVTKTTSAFQSEHSEANIGDLQVENAFALQQSTDFQFLTVGTGNGADETLSGMITLFNPSSTTFVKNFITNTNEYNAGNGSNSFYTAGYGNTTSAVNAIRFQMSSGNIDVGTIKMYGIKGN